MERYPEAGEMNQSPVKHLLNVNIFSVFRKFYRFNFDFLKRLRHEKLEKNTYFGKFEQNVDDQQARSSQFGV